MASVGSEHHVLDVLAAVRVVQERIAKHEVLLQEIRNDVFGDGRFLRRDDARSEGRIESRRLEIKVVHEQQDELDGNHFEANLVANVDEIVGSEGDPEDAEDVEKVDTTRDGERGCKRKMNEDKRVKNNLTHKSHSRFRFRKRHAEARNNVQLEGRHQQRNPDTQNGKDVVKKGLVVRRPLHNGANLRLNSKAKCDDEQNVLKENEIVPHLAEHALLLLVRRVQYLQSNPKSTEYNNIMARKNEERAHDAWIQQVQKHHRKLRV